MNEDKALLEAEFETKLKAYWFLQVLLGFVVSIIGIPLALFWVLGWGQWWAKRSYESLRCILYERSLVVKRGVVFKTEKTIPLDKIQDLTVREGPLLRAFGLRSLKIETAGQSSPQGRADADLVGVVDFVQGQDHGIEGAIAKLFECGSMIGGDDDLMTSFGEPVGQ